MLCAVDEKGRFQARCDGCLRMSPVVAAPKDGDAATLLVALGWLQLLDLWACPVCQGRSRRARRA